MTLDSQDKNYLAKLVLALVFGVIVVGGLVLAGLHFFLNEDIQSFETYLTTHFNRRPGDTPVVLIGDSLILKSPYGDWKEVNPGIEYSVVLDYPVTRVARKKNWNNESGNDNLDPDDPDPSKDLDSQSVPNGWTINLFTANSATTPAVTVAPYGNEIHVKKGTGFLCRTKDSATDKDSKRRIRYGASSDCSDDVKFTRAEITGGGPPKDCVDKTYKTGKCKFVLVE